MKIKCVSVTHSALPEDILRSEPYYTRDGVFGGITVGNVYVVYGWTVVDNYAWYYICDNDWERDRLYPLWYAAPLFEIVDRRVSRYWEIDSSPGERCESQSGIIVAFHEWVSDPFFYERLTDCDPDAVAVFRKYKRLIDEEFEH